MKCLVIIPARGGSKGIPKKNIKILNGKPLIYYTIDVAREIFEDKDICVTTDSEEIKSVVEQTGLKVPFIRPKHLATDEAGTYEVLLHAVNWYEQKGRHYDVVLLLQPTSPFRTTENVKAALKLFTSDLDMIVSVKETKSNPYYVLFEEDKFGFLKKSKDGNFTRRQDVPPVYELNGAIYVMNIKSLKEKSIVSFEKNKKIVMNDYTSIDIDTALDWQIAEGLLRT